MINHDLKTKCGITGNNRGRVLVVYNRFAEEYIDCINAKFPDSGVVLLDYSWIYEDHSILDEVELMRPSKPRWPNISMIKNLVKRRFDVYVIVSDTVDRGFFQRIFACAVFPRKVAVFEINEKRWEICGYGKHFLTTLIEGVSVFLLLPFCYIFVFLAALYRRKSIRAMWGP